QESPLNALRTYQKACIKIPTNCQGASYNVAKTTSLGCLSQELYEECARKRAEKHKKRVAASRLGVADVVGIKGQDGGRDQGNAAVEKLPTKPVQNRNSCRRWQDRKRADEKLAVSEV